MIRRSIHGGSGLTRYKSKVQSGQSRLIWNRSNGRNHLVRNHFDGIKLHFCNNSTGLSPSPACLYLRFQKLYCPSHGDRAPSATKASNPNTFTLLIGELGHHGCINSEAFGLRFCRLCVSQFPIRRRFGDVSSHVGVAAPFVWTGHSHHVLAQSPTSVISAWSIGGWRWRPLRAPILRKRPVSARYRYLVSDRPSL